MLLAMIGSFQYVFCHSLQSYSLVMSMYFLHSYLSTCAIVLGPNQLPTGLPSDTPI